METLMHLTTSNGKKLMLRITTQKRRGKTLLSIEGRLAGPLVGTLEQCWRELRAAAPGEKLHLNLCGVSFIDAAGKMLLKEIHRQGGELIQAALCNQFPALAVDFFEQHLSGGVNEAHPAQI